MALFDQAPSFGQFGFIKLTPLPTGLGNEETSGTGGAKELSATLDRHQSNAEGLGDMTLGGASLDDQLAGEHPETGQILPPVSEDGQMPIVIDHLIAIGPAGQIPI